MCLLEFSLLPFIEYSVLRITFVVTSFRFQEQRRPGGACCNGHSTKFCPPSPLPLPTPSTCPCTFACFTARRRTSEQARGHLDAGVPPQAQPNSPATMNQVLRERQATSGGVTEMPSPSLEIAPLATLEELLGYERPGWGQGFAPARPAFVPPAFPPLRSRLLVCHDLAGGYGQDSLVQGGGYDRAYRMYDWNLVDIFVYFRLVGFPWRVWLRPVVNSLL